MTKDEAATLLKEEVKGLSSNLTDPEDYYNALDQATRDTQWDAPWTTDFKEKWILERAKRHIFFFMATESAHKFKYKQISLNHRFEHYFSLVKFMDKQFEDEKERNPSEFPDDLDIAGVSDVQLYGTKIDAGFQYEPQTGRDFTYSETTNEPIITPDADD